MISICLCLTACDRQPSPTTPPNSASPRVVSLVPAATDLIVGMGAADHLVGISHYDTPRDEIRNLPRVGDYQNCDWEQISLLRPRIMIVFMAPDRMPEGLKQRADQRNIRLLNIRTERLEDIFTETTKLGDALNESPKATEFIARLRTRLDAVRQHAANKPRPRTLLVREKSADAVVGRDNFLNDILEIAGGQNVIQRTGWVPTDREELLSLKPQVIIQLLPDASPQVIDEAKRVWALMPQLPAVRDGRVHILTDWYAQQPGSHIADLAEEFAHILHPEAHP